MRSARYEQRLALKPTAVARAATLSDDDFNDYPRPVAARRRR
jgi:hypothetical protein